jgi:hypothetical protein
MPKGERVLAQSKRTAPPCQFQKKIETSLSFKCFSIGIFEISIPLRISISIDIYILKEEFYQKVVSIIFDLPSIGKTLLNPKRRISRGEFCLVKGKAFETGGENFNS